MSSTKIAALVLMALGALGLVYGGFTYTRETHEANIGPLNLTVEDTERVTVPTWVGLGVLLIGGALFVASRKPSDQANGEHQEILDACNRGDAKAAQRAIREHLRHASGELAEQLIARATDGAERDGAGAD